MQFLYVRVGFSFFDTLDRLLDKQLLGMVLVVRFGRFILMALVKKLVAVVCLHVVRPITILHLRLAPRLVSISGHQQTSFLSTLQHLKLLLFAS